MAMFIPSDPLVTDPTPFPKPLLSVTTLRIFKIFCKLHYIFGTNSHNKGTARQSHFQLGKVFAEAIAGILLFTLLI